MSSIPFTSSPLNDAGIGTSPRSTLDTGGGTEGILADASSIIGSVGNVILGGLAISRIPSNAPNVQTSVQARASGVTVTQSPTNALGVAGSINLTSILIIGVVIVAVWYLAKHL